MSPVVDRIIGVARTHRPLSFANRDAYRDELLAALALDGLEVRGACRVFGGRVDLLVAGEQVAILVRPEGEPTGIHRRLRRLADGGDLAAIVVLTDEPALTALRHFPCAVPVTIASIPRSGAQAVEEVRAA